MAADLRSGRINDTDLRLEWNCLPWDSSIFGFPVLQISAIEILGNNAPAQFKEFERLRDEMGCDFSSCRLGAAQLRESMLLEAHGFRFIEMVYAPELLLEQPSESIPDPGLQVSLADDSDYSAAADIAAVAFVNERFQVDPRIPTGYGAQRYRNWVISVKGHARQQLFVVRDGRNMVAFFVTEDLPDGTRYWHLNAVAPEFQGRRYGLRSWQAMIENARRSAALRVRSSIVARNYRVLNLYAQLGFRFSVPSMTFHWLRSA
jgi:GNAT superfamily N-acetyltransferase